jgi:hypothetical protein
MGEGGALLTGGLGKDDVHGPRARQRRHRLGRYVQAGPIPARFCQTRTLSSAGTIRVIAFT